MCGCGKGKLAKTRKPNGVLAASPPANNNPLPVSTVAPFNAAASNQMPSDNPNFTPRAMSEEEKRIFKLRRDAIRRSLGR